MHTLKKYFIFLNIANFEIKIEIFKCNPSAARHLKRQLNYSTESLGTPNTPIDVHLFCLKKKTQIEMNLTDEENLESFIREAEAINKEEEIANNKRKLSEDKENDSKRGKLNDNENPESTDKNKEDDCEIVEKIVPLIHIKDEPDDSTEISSNQHQPSTSVVKMKQEPAESTSENVCSSIPNVIPVAIVVPSVKQEPSTVVKEEASSSTRESCKYGVRCYR